MRKIMLVILFLFPSLVLADSAFKPDSQQALNNFTQYMVDKGIKQTLKGNNVIPFRSNNVVTASEVIADYEANQLKANKIYLNRLTRIQTVADSIDAGILDEPYIVANGENPFEQILIYIDPEDERFLDITAGDDIDLICKGKGYEITSPTFGDCIFSKDYAEQGGAIIIANLKKASDNNYKPKFFEEAKLLQMYLSFEPIIQAACDSTLDKCIQNLRAKDSDYSKAKHQITPKVEAITDYIKENRLKSVLSEI